MHYLKKFWWLGSWHLGSHWRYPYNLVLLLRRLPRIKQHLHNLLHLLGIFRQGQLLLQCIVRNQAERPEPTPDSLKYRCLLGSLQFRIFWVRLQQWSCYSSFTPGKCLALPRRRKKWTVWQSPSRRYHRHLDDWLQSRKHSQQLINPERQPAAHTISLRCSPAGHIFTVILVI